MHLGRALRLRICDFPPASRIPRFKEGIYQKTALCRHGCASHRDPDEPCPAPKVYWHYFGSLMEVSRSHTFASWFSRSIKYMSPEISTTIPTPLGICTLSLSLGLQTSMGLFLVVRGNAPTCLTDLRNELNPPRGGFVIILLLSDFSPITWLKSQCGL